jgi:hypothetical protein
MTDEISQLKKVLAEHEERIIKLERAIHATSAKPKTIQVKRSIFGRLIALKSEHFFDDPRTLREIVEKLAEQSYHYPPQSLTEPLQRAVRTGELGRVKKEGLWAYCKR